MIITFYCISVCQECLRIEAVVDCSDCQLALCEECDDKRHADPTGGERLYHIFLAVTFVMVVYACYVYGRACEGIDRFEYVMSRAL